MKLKSAKSTYTFGETVDLVLEVTNTSDHEFRHTQHRGDGTGWVEHDGNSVAGLPFNPTGVIVEQEFGSGETKRVRLDWDQATCEDVTTDHYEDRTDDEYDNPRYYVPRGAYTAYAFWFDQEDHGWLANPVTFTIE